MAKRSWFIATLFFTLFSLLLTVSCSKKSVKRGYLHKKALEGETNLSEEAIEEKVRAELHMFQYNHVYFDFDSSVLKEEARILIKEKERWLTYNPAEKVIIQGHSDERGTVEYNLALGDRRAKSVKAYLVNLGISPSRLSSISYGEEQPLDKRHNEEAWATNRRAQFVIK